MSTPVILIPARWASSRFPGKPLALIDGIPLILRVCQRASLAFGSEVTSVVTDDERIHQTVSNAGFQSVLRQYDAATGTDRIADAIGDINGDIFINVQGDEPLVDPDDIRRIYEEKLANPASVVNGYCAINTLEALESSSTPKVVVDSDSNLLYISRAVIPAQKSLEPYSVVGDHFFRQVCIYAFNRDELEFFARTPRDSVEVSEDIEVLRFLMAGRSVRMVRCQPTECAVDNPEDISIVEKQLRLLCDRP